MTRHKKWLGLGTAFVAAVLIFSAFAASDLHAQQAGPAPVAPKASATASPTTSPVPPKTGNAGLLGTTGTSLVLATFLGVAALALVAGARTATREL